VLSGKYDDGVPAGSRMAQDTEMAHILRRGFDSAQGRERIEKVPSEPPTLTACR
jgi:hypothetical protein